MSSFIKYRVRDVAKDFDRAPKEIINILGKYGAAPKNNMQVLEDGELSILFDYLTQNNQVAVSYTHLTLPTTSRV